MRHVYLVANLDRQDVAERLAESLRRHLDGRQDIVGSPRIMVRRGRVNVEGVREDVAVELREWCADRVREV
ncbi:MAG: hypothetical protein BMS9Abin37_2616 [Acidobacteriota bacterium]|nr:MAG: hypothetical protein BMS9Abin37_2616 [Acidobacteriota bacterium]